MYDLGHTQGQALQVCTTLANHRDKISITFCYTQSRLQCLVLATHKNKTTKVCMTLVTYKCMYMYDLDYTQGQASQVCTTLATHSQDFNGMVGFGYLQGQDNRITVRMILANPKTRLHSYT